MNTNQLVQLVLEIENKYANISIFIWFFLFIVEAALSGLQKMFAFSMV